MNYATALIHLPLVRESRGQPVRTPEQVLECCCDLRDLAQEAFHVLLLDTKNVLINRHMISLGIVNSSLVHAREVLRAAVTEGAAGIILVHNHPSGDPSPSIEDLRITRQLVQAGKIIDIPVLDHVIIGRSGRAFTSMRDDALVEF